MSGWLAVADLDLCQAHQLCQSEAPDVFGFDRAADKVVLLERRDLARDDDDVRADVRRAVGYCPAMALSLVEED